jgi:putative aldouronate transport system permease protein
MRRRTVGDDRFGFWPAAIWLVLGLLTLTMLMPFVNMLARSLSWPDEIAAGRVTLWPRHFTLGGYAYFARWTMLPRVFLNSLYVTVAGVLWCVFFTALTAYPLSRRRSSFKLGPFVMVMLVITMIFGRPLIPYFIAVKTYGLMDNLFGSLVVTKTIDAFNTFLAVLYFREIEEELFEAARIDGAGDLLVFWRIVLPLAKPILATLAVFTAINQWNLYQSPLMFIRKSALTTLQIFISTATATTGDESTVKTTRDVFRDSETVKNALILASILPMLLFYPLMQRHFVAGIRLGGLKG